ncbi:MAG: NAD(P)/FAD-dependent oxidoreductase [Calditrichia bacterium]
MPKEMTRKTFHTIIIGSGPAGLFAGIALSEAGISNIAIMDKLLYPAGGLINDGKLNFDYRIGIDLKELSLNREEAEQYIAKVKEYFISFPKCVQVTDPTNDTEIREWAEVAKEQHVEFIAPEQWHYGTDNSKEMVDFLRTRFKGELMLGYEVLEVKPDDKEFIVKVKAEDKIEVYRSAYIIAAPGRKGAYWWKKNAQELGIETKFGRIDVGIRVELNRKFYDPITRVVYDPKFKILTRRHRDRVRTFCTNPGGRVRTENYDGFRLVNGDALASQRSENTNFALLNTVGLTKPFSDSTEFGRFIAYIFSLLGGGRPIMQRVGDFREGRRSKEETFYSSAYHFDECHPTLNAVPGDISLGFPARIMDNLWESLKTLDKIVPGVLHPSTIMYAPEIKFFDTKYITNKYLESSYPGIFLAGDGTGKSRGIVGAAVSGMLAAEGILKK